MAAFIPLDTTRLSVVMCIGVTLIAISHISVASLIMVGGTDQSCSEGWVMVNGCKCCVKETRTEVICEGKNITQIPTGLPLNTTHLTFTKTGLTNVSGDPNSGQGGFMSSRFNKYEKLVYLSFNNNPDLQNLTLGAFDFTGGKGALSNLFIKGSPKLQNIPHGVLGNFQTLKSLHITDCGLTEPPGLGIFNAGKGVFEELNLARNHIRRLKMGSFSDLSTTVSKLTLESNDLKEIEGKVFEKSTIGYIQLQNNKELTLIAEYAFSDVQELTTLDLSNTAIISLPTMGLSNLQNLIIEDTPALREFPPVLKLPSMLRAKLTYAHHCCAFAHPDRQDEQLWKEFEIMARCSHSTTQTSSVTVVPTMPSTTPSLPGGGIWGSSLLKSEKDRHSIHKLKFFQNQPYSWESQSKYNHQPNPLKTGMWHTSTLNPHKNHTGKTIDCGILARIKETQCTPKPDAFNPCEDVMGSTFLRVSAWIVIGLALFGNLVVFSVTACSSFSMTVHKFLMCNLSLSDFLLGCYLLFLSIIDGQTIGVYFTKAIPWQLGGGCQMAGFIAVFASNLSISTLVIITIERWYAITHAIDLTKRLKLRESFIIMICFWIYSLLMAMLPLLGVSSYSKTSICLPMKADSIIDKSYIIVLLIFNTFGFIIICCCYVDMYRQVRGNKNAAGRNDASVAKKMAVLVFTDFICLFPIALFGITAAAGKPLITVSESKILLVFFFPINSCCNPFLYAIFTKQFRKDFYGLLIRWGICERRAAKYRYTNSSNPMSVSQSRNSICGNLNHIVKSSSGAIIYNRCATKDNKINDVFVNNTGSTNSTKTSTPLPTPFNSMKNSPQCTPPLKCHIPMENVTQLHNEVMRKLSVVREVSKVSSASDDESNKLYSNKDCVLSEKQALAAQENINEEYCEL